MLKAPSQYVDVADVFRRYWVAYGGSRALLGSPYFHLSGLLTAASFGTWSSPGWWSQVIAILPNLLGFSLAGLAVLLGFGSDSFRRLISGASASGGASPFVLAVSAFVHFILVQVFALMLAMVLGAAWQIPLSVELLSDVNDIARRLLWPFAYWVFIYSVCCLVAAVFAVFRVATWFDLYVGRDGEEAAARSEKADSRGSAE